MAAKNKVDVRIAGKDYTLMGVESDEYMQRIGLYIDKKMNEIMKMNSKLSTSMAAVLTAINVADDYFKSNESEGIAKTDIQRAQEEIARLRQMNKGLAEENSVLSAKNSNLQLELAKREAEIKEIRNLMEKASITRE